MEPRSASGIQTETLRAHVLVNSAAGTVRGKNENRNEKELRQLLAANSVDAELLWLKPQQIAAAARTAIKAKPDVIVAVGGDGTVGSIAQVLVNSGIALGIIPLGTFNLIARAYGIPLQPEKAVEVIASHNVSRVDAGELNGRAFVNNSLLGAYPRFVIERDSISYQTKAQKFAAMIKAMARVMSRFPQKQLDIVAGNEQWSLVTPFAHIGVGASQLALRGDRGLSDYPGKLCLSVARRTSPLATCFLALRELAGLGRDERMVLTYQGDEIVISSRGRRRLRVSLDGEVVTLDQPLRYRALPNALALCVPEA